MKLKKGWACIFLFVVVACSSVPIKDGDLDKLSPEKLNQMAVDLWKNGKYTDPETALKYVNTAIEINPEYGRAYYTRGFIYGDLKKYQSAIDSFTEALGLDPNIQETYNGRGWAYSVLDQHKKAIEDYTKAIEIDPKYKLAYNNRAMSYLKLNQNEKACIDFQKVCELGDCQNIKHARKIGKCQ